MIFDQLMTFFNCSANRTFRHENYRKPKRRSVRLKKIQKVQKCKSFPKRFSGKFWYRGFATQKLCPPKQFDWKPLPRLCFDRLKLDDVPNCCPRNLTERWRTWEVNLNKFKLCIRRQESTKERNVYAGGRTWVIKRITLAASQRRWSGC